MPIEPVLEVENLTRRFGDVVALDGIDFEVPAGQVVGLLGHNGAGKTTTIRLLNGLLGPTGGRVRTLGRDPLSEGPEVRRHTGVLTETPSLDDRMTAGESLRFWADMWGVPSDTAELRIGSLLERFELAERADDRVGGYSRGMRQRLALARALIHDPAVLFLDEPTAALDPIAALGVRDLVRSLAADDSRTVLICTHNLAEAQDLCDRVIILRSGRVVADGTTAEVAGVANLPVRVRLEVDPDHVDTAVALTQVVDGASAVAGEDGWVTIEDMHRESIPGLVRELVSAGVALYRLVPEEPTLEAAYVALYRQEDRP